MQTTPPKGPHAAANALSEIAATLIGREAIRVPRGGCANTRRTVGTQYGKQHMKRPEREEDIIDPQDRPNRRSSGIGYGGNQKTGGSYLSQQEFEAVYPKAC